MRPRPRRIDMPGSVAAARFPAYTGLAIRIRSSGPTSPATCGACFRRTPTSGPRTPSTARSSRSIFRCRSSGWSAAWPTSPGSKASKSPSCAECSPQSRARFCAPLSSRPKRSEFRHQARCRIQSGRPLRGRQHRVMQPFRPASARTSTSRSSSGWQNGTTTG